MPDEHAVLSPSSAERWLACPASVLLSQQIPQPPDTSYALEGTCAHDLAQIEGRLAMGQITAAEATRERNLWRKKWQKRIGLTEEQEEEMALHVAAYVALIVERVAEHPDTVVMFEQRVTTGIPSCWGTSDAVLVSPLHVEAVDLKYGAGVKVYAPGNPQLRLYGVGALENFGELLGDPEFVKSTVFQPRLSHVDTETLTRDELVEWRDSILPAAELALTEDAPFNPGEEQCRWCPASGQCRAQMEWATARDFSAPPQLLTNEELAAQLEDVEGIRAWCNAVVDAAFDKIRNRKEDVGGWKVVRTNGRRTIKDHEKVINGLVGAGHSLEQVSKRTAKGLGELEKLLTAEEFDKYVAPYAPKGDGKEVLAPANDSRVSVDPTTDAQKDFS